MLHMLTYLVLLDHPESVDRLLMRIYFIPVKFLLNTTNLQVPPLRKCAIVLSTRTGCPSVIHFSFQMGDSCFKCYPQTRVGFLKNVNSLNILIRYHGKDVVLSRFTTIQICKL